MITQEEMKRIYKNVNTSYTGLVIDGECKYSYQITTVPHFEEIISDALEDLSLMVKSIGRVSPANANCIIRVYRHENMKVHEDVHWIWGVEIYFRTFNGYISADGFKINYEEHSITKYLFQDESVLLRPDFVDIYLKIK